MRNFLLSIINSFFFICLKPYCIFLDGMKFHILSSFHRQLLEYAFHFFVLADLSSCMINLLFLFLKVSQLVQNSSKHTMAVTPVKAQLQAHPLQHWFGAAPVWAVHLLFLGIAFDVWYEHYSNIADPPAWGSAFITKYYKYEVFGSPANIFKYMQIICFWTSVGWMMNGPFAKQQAEYYETSVRQIQNIGGVWFVLSCCLHNWGLAGPRRDFNITFVRYFCCLGA